MEQIERYQGSMLGLASGDAVGTTVEFQRPGSFKPVTDMTGDGPFDLEAGEWTDDTSMALCLADSLIEKQAFDPIDQLERYCRWYKEGYFSVKGYLFDIGFAVKEALDKFLKTHEPYPGSTDPKKAGNGSIMRLAPVPLFYACNPAEAIERSGESSRTTHGATTTIDACRYMGGLIVGAVNGASKDELLSDHYSPIPGYWQTHPLTPAIDEIAAGSFKRKNPPEIIGSGYVVKSLEAALWAFYNSDSFEEGCLKAVNLGNDADTTGAVYGQIAGAFYGEENIPASWRNKLAMREKIEQMADKLYQLSRQQCRQDKS